LERRDWQDQLEHQVSGEHQEPLVQAVGLEQQEGQDKLDSRDKLGALVLKGLLVCLEAAVEQGRRDRMGLAGLSVSLAGQGCKGSRAHQGILDLWD